MRTSKVIEEDKIDLGEHRSVARHTAELINWSESSLTMRKILNNKRRIAVWARTLPLLTIIQVGACDLANRGVSSHNVSGSYKRAVMLFIDLFIKEAMSSLHTQVERDRLKYHLEYRHMFLKIAVPDWGGFGKGRMIALDRYPDIVKDFKLNGSGRNRIKKYRSLDEDEFRKARRNANKGIVSAKKVLWKKYRMVLFAPRTDHNSSARPNDVHLYGQAICTL